MRRWIFSIAILALFCALVFSGWKVWQQAEAYERETLLIIEQLETETQLKNSGRKLLEVISFGLYDGYSQKLEALNLHQEQQAAHASSVQIMTGLFLTLGVVLILFGWLLRGNLRDAAYTMLAVALVALIVGLTTPILSVEASGDLPLIGETVFQFQSKGILSTITVLQESGNLWLAMILALFSILIPIMKTLVAGLTLFSATHHYSLRGLHLSRHLGKWSMADVFVVAILIAFFANSSEEGLTQAEVQAGLWFFATYVVLSLLGTQIISHFLPGPGSGGEEVSL